MSEPRSRILSWFLLAGILAGVHTVIFLLITVFVILSGDPMAGMAYYWFYYLDSPISRLYELPEYSSPGAMLVLGGLLWFCYGFIAQSLFSIRHVAGILRLATGVAVLCYLCLLPEFSLKSMPGWKEQWERGRTASEADMETKIWHVAEAVRLVPKDEPTLSGMWDYLGRLYMNQKDYERAEEAFKESLTVASNDPNPPVQTLWIYNNLGWLHERTGDTQRRKECLVKAIEFNRVVHGDDSVEEAHCWSDLAEIARASGGSAEARELLERAIKIRSALPSHETFTLKGMKDQLEQWTKEDKASGPVQ
jgi:Tetratricopeptide repeat